MNAGTEILVDYLLILIGFILFMFIQALFINSVYELFKGNCIEKYIIRGRFCDGNLLYKISPIFFERNKQKQWAKPIFTCVRCMASLYGSITFWIPVIWLFNFCSIEIYFWIVDIVSLVSLNWYIYKRL